MFNQKYEKNRKDVFTFWNTSYLLRRNTQLNKCLGILHCKTHESAWILNVNIEKLDEVCWMTSKWKKCFISLLWISTKKLSFCLCIFLQVKRYGKLEKKPYDFFFSISNFWSIFAGNRYLKNERTCNFGHTQI